MATRALRFRPSLRYTRDFAIAWRASLQRSATVYKTAIEVLEY